MFTLANGEDPDGGISSGYTLFAKTEMICRERSIYNVHFFEIISHDPSIYTMDHPKFIVSKPEG